MFEHGENLVVSAVTANIPQTSLVTNFISQRETDDGYFTQ
ncbi:hypothetical protein HMPREF0970_01302 [Schaalia odontolytica F0309]|uniref:Uncharacterized protein n=1 Tax=Schaalia odontolytica F0309 TaxID=649742 RepID=D4TZC1_9ACTO|nr:hypothetical protein HMPREF0970_01302 [Schaalia odontolytica F0309]